MFKQLSPFARAGIFYALALALALGVTFIPGAGSALYMFTPLAAVMLMQLVITRDGYARDGWQVLGLGRLGLQAWTPAVLVPLLVMGVAYGIIWITGLARLVVPTDIDDIPVAYVPLVAVLLVLKSSLTVALGEELGWRGYLLPHIETLGRWRAALLSGLLHGIWHLPLIFLTSVYHAGVDPVVFVPLFLASLMTAGVFFAYVRLTTGSMWPATIAHSAHNVFWALFVMFTSASSPMVTEYLVGDVGILLTFGYAVTSGYLMYTVVKHQNSNREPTSGAIVGHDEGRAT